MPEFDLNAALRKAPYDGPLFQKSHTLLPEAWLRKLEADRG